MMMMMITYTIYRCSCSNCNVQWLQYATHRFTIIQI